MADSKTSTAVLDEARAMLQRKGADYSVDNDPLAQFRRAARDLDVDMRTVWGVYFDKGIAAIRKWIKGETLASEGIRERVVDAIAYLTILTWIIDDEKLRVPDDDMAMAAADRLNALRAVAHSLDILGDDTPQKIYEIANELALIMSVAIGAK